VRGIRGELWGSRGTRGCGGTDSPPTTSGAVGSMDRFPVLPVPPRGNGSSASAVPICSPNLRPERMLERVSAAPRGPRPPEQCRPAGFCPSVGPWAISRTARSHDDDAGGSRAWHGLELFARSQYTWALSRRLVAGLALPGHEGFGAVIAQTPDSRCPDDVHTIAKFGSAEVARARSALVPPDR
jgi:hypothetical protein